MVTPSLVWSVSTTHVFSSFLYGQTVDCPVIPPNDACDDATEISVPTQLEASAQYADPLDNYTSCQSIQYGWPSVWYKFTGTGGCVQVTTRVFSSSPFTSNNESQTTNSVAKGFCWLS